MERRIYYSQKILLSITLVQPFLECSHHLATIRSFFYSYIYPLLLLLQFNGLGVESMGPQWFGQIWGPVKFVAERLTFTYQTERTFSVFPAELQARMAHCLYESLNLKNNSQ